MVQKGGVISHDGLVLLLADLYGTGHLVCTAKDTEKAESIRSIIDGGRREGLGIEVENPFWEGHGQGKRLERIARPKGKPRQKEDGSSPEAFNDLFF